MVLTPRTHVAERENFTMDFPMTFLELSDIVNLSPDSKPDYLVDVIAYVKEIGTLDEYRKDDEVKHKITMRLCDLEDNIVECVLFDECANDIDMCQVQNMSGPVVIILYLARVAFHEDGKAQILNSFNATKVSFNPAIEEVKTMNERANEHKPPIILKCTESLGKNIRQLSQTPSLNRSRAIKTSSIMEQKVGEAFMITCVLVKLQTMHGWMYEGCPKCASKPHVEDSIVMCGGCKKKLDCIEPKMKVHYIIKDESGTASIVFWDRLASQLFGKSARQMKLKLDEEDRSYDFPEELDDVVGKRMVITLKLNEYNKNHPNSSISVVSFSLCENLLDKFNAADDMVNPVVDLSEEADSCLIADNSVGSSRGVGIKRITPSLKSSKDNAAYIVEGNVINFASGKENEDVKVGEELPKGVVTGKQTKGRCKRQLLKDDTEVLKEVQNISSSVQRS